MNPQKIKYLHTISTCIVIIIITFLAYMMLFHAKLTNNPHKYALITIMNNLLIDDSKNKVDNIFEKYKTDKLKLNKFQENKWCITIPLEFGATDWKLWIDFENDRIKELKIRLTDSINMKPKGVPEDKIKK